MTTPTYAELKAGLTEDIESMRLQIMRLENQILKNEIVLKEVEVHERCMAALKRTMLEDAKAEEKATQRIINDKHGKPAVVVEYAEAPVTVLDMVKAYLAPFGTSDTPFTFGAMISWCAQKYPAVPLDKIRMGVYTAVKKLKEAGVIMNAGKGYMKLKPAA